MGELPFTFERINETTWAYLSSFLMIALFFKFNRFWSVRNLDLLLIILLAPGILMVHSGQRMLPQAQNELRIIEARISESLAGEATENTLPVEEAPDGNTAAEPAVKALDNPNSDSERLPNPDRALNVATVDEANEEASKLAPDNPLAVARQQAISNVMASNRLQAWGYYWLFTVGLLFLTRLIWDNGLVRRPLLESNLTIGGLVFLGCTLMIFLFLNVIKSTATPEDIRGVQSAAKLLQREEADEQDMDELLQRGPGYTILSLLPAISSSGGDVINGELDKDEEPGEPEPPTEPTDDLKGNATENQQRIIQRGNPFVIAAKSLAIASQFAIVLGLIMISYWHFNNFRAGVEAATIYLILPYTAIYMGHVMHALPAALLVWAVASFKRPFVAGLLIGFSVGVSYYPLFLLVLWVSFYWEKGKWPFIYGVLTALAICTLGLIFTSVSFDHFLTQLQRMLGAFAPRMKNLGGIWQLGWDQWYRMPLLAGFIAFSASYAFWPVQKNIGALISCSAAIMVALQFWHGMDGGTYLAYYMPLAVVVFLRPNVDGRDAVRELE